MEPEAPESGGRSHEHSPWVQGIDQSFTARACQPAARISARWSVAEGLMKQGIWVIVMGIHQDLL